MRYKLLAAAAAFFMSSPALAQSSGTVTANAFAIGKGAGQSGFASLLCAQAQLAVGQSAAAPICRTLTGDVTIDAAGATTIGANKVTNSQLATTADGTIKSNISGSTAAPSDNGISAVLDKLLGNTRGSVIYRGALSWSSLGPSTSGFLLRTNGAGADPSWAAGGSGTVTSVGLTNSYGLSVSGSPVTGSGNISAGVSLTTLTNSLASNVSLNNTGSTFTGPTVAQGSIGTWLATGTVTLVDSSTAAAFNCTLSDGTTTISSARTVSVSANSHTTIALSGVLASPAGNIRISCQDPTSVNGVIVANTTGSGKDSTITVIRIQ